LTTETQVKERPILFTGPMVRAIIEGRKTQTRRVVKPMPFIDYPTGWRLQQEYKLEHHVKCSFVQANMLCDCCAIYEPWQIERIAACPYGKPGDRLWVRETFATRHPYDLEEEHLTYRADYLELSEGILSAGWGWRPSIFMPRAASRITLEVTGVRVERLQDISEADAIAEGVYTNEQAIEKLGLPSDTKLSGSCVDKYRIVWDSINGKKYPWASNPWVWCIEFKKL
jgi:hypothetical protein